MKQVKSVEEALDTSEVLDFTQPEWLDQRGVNILPADEPQEGRFGFVLFDKTNDANAAWPLRQAWPKATPVEHVQYEHWVNALSGFVSGDILCLRCHDVKKLRLGFLAAERFWC